MLKSFFHIGQCLLHCIEICVWNCGFSSKMCPYNNFSICISIETKIGFCLLSFTAQSKGNFFYSFVFQTQCVSASKDIPHELGVKCSVLQFIEVNSIKLFYHKRLSLNTAVLLTKRSK